MNVTCFIESAIRIDGSEGGVARADVWLVVGVAGDMSGSVLCALTGVLVSKVSIATLGDVGWISVESLEVKEL